MPIHRICVPFCGVQDPHNLVDFDEMQSFPTPVIIEQLLPLPWARKQVISGFLAQGSADLGCTLDLEVGIVLVIPFLLDFQIEVRLSFSPLSFSTWLLLRYEGVVVGVLGVIADPSLIEYRDPLNGALLVA